MEKFLENLEEANKIIRTVDHMTYVTLTLVKDKRLLLKILLETKIAITNCINAILQYEYLYKRITLYKKSSENLRSFKERCAKRYNITDNEIRLIEELFDIVEKHKQSSFEFMKNNRVIILSEDLKPETLSIERIKEFLLLAKNILKKANQKILA